MQQQGGRLKWQTHKTGLFGTFCVQTTGSLTQVRSLSSIGPFLPEYIFIYVYILDIILKYISVFGTVFAVMTTHFDLKFSGHILANFMNTFQHKIRSSVRLKDF